MMLGAVRYPCFSTAEAAVSLQQCPTICNGRSTRLRGTTRLHCTAWQQQQQQQETESIHVPDLLNRRENEGIHVPDLNRRSLLMQGIILSLSGKDVQALASDDASSSVSSSSDDDNGSDGGKNATSVLDFAVTDKVFFDIAIDREPAGRIVVGLFGQDVPLGAKRFAEIAAGRKGLSYRKKDFYKITPFYVQNSGLRSFNSGGGPRDAAQFTGGDTADALLPELDALGRRLPPPITKNMAGTVSLVVRDLTKPPPKSKLVAKDGKFEVIEEELRPDPNATEFAITTKDAPQLDSSNLVVGKVLDGLDVVEKISKVRVVQDNTNSPYFRAAKLIGDTRAVVAERGFNRPFSKITITGCGRLDN